MSETWLTTLKFNPVPTLLSSGNKAIEYFTKRDLFGEKVDTISFVWHLPEVQRVFQKQQPDGSWRQSGRGTVRYPTYHYSLVQTWKTFYPLVEEYQINKEHEGASKASEFLFSCQTDQGDIRGMAANQYATYYTGAMLAILIKTGYENDLRVEKGFNWLLSMRQDDGGWTIPILTHKYDKKTFYNLTSYYAEPIEPDRSKPFSHNWTDMVLRAFAAHPKHRICKEALKAADLLKSSFFQPDFYSSLKDSRYWVRFLFWWPNLETALDSLSLMSYSKDDADIKKALSWLIENQLSNGLWKLSYNETTKEGSLSSEKSKERSLWLTLAIARIMKRFYSN